MGARHAPSPYAPASRSRQRGRLFLRAARVVRRFAPTEAEVIDDVRLQGSTADIALTETERRTEPAALPPRR